jgi:hypothetical protein
MAKSSGTNKSGGSTDADGTNGDGGGKPKALSEEELAKAILFLMTWMHMLRVV